jgi:hypothetical protein
MGLCAGDFYAGCMTNTETINTAAIDAATTSADTTNPAATSAAPERIYSILALIAGIASVVFGQTFLVPAAAIVLGILGLRREPHGRTMSIWGIVLGAVMLFGWIVVALIGAAVFLPLAILGSI